MTTVHTNAGEIDHVFVVRASSASVLAVDIMPVLFDDYLRLKGADKRNFIN